MGVLEDAIREHLDLRKRHGVSEEELRRQEAEALGPARREAEAVPEEHAVATEPAEEAVDAQAVEPADVQSPPQTEDAEPSEVPAGEALEEPALAERFHAGNELMGDETAVYRPPEIEKDADEQSPEPDRHLPEKKPPSDLDFE
jgi:hypothetical protein